MFADTFAAAQILHDRVPAAYKILTEFEVTYAYSRDGQRYSFSRPTIVPERSLIKVWFHARPIPASHMTMKLDWQLQCACNLY